MTLAMITVKALFFGATADAIGSRSVEIPVSSEACVDDVLAILVEKHPNLRPMKLLIAVNEEYTDGTRSLTDGDEVAVFTAVSGG